MKKIGLIIAAAILTALLSVNSFALSERTTTISVQKVGETTPAIDGKFDPDEGWGEPIANITPDIIANYCTDPGEAKDTSVAAYYRWDETNLYLCMVVGDPAHYNEQTNPGGIWQGDSARLDIKCDMLSDDLQDTSKYFIGLNNDGEVLVNQEKVETTIADRSPAQNKDTGLSAYAVSRDDSTGTTVYEIAFAWNKNVPEASRSIIKTGFKFVTECRVLCQDSAEEGEPLQAIQPAGVNEDGLFWYVAELVEAPVIIDETEPQAASDDPLIAESASAQTSTPAPQTGDTSMSAAIILASAALISVASALYSGKKAKYNR